MKPEILVEVYERVYICGRMQEFVIAEVDRRGFNIIDILERLLLYASIIIITQASRCSLAQT